jgi:DNA-binding transcriptional LysR family regulator
MRTKEQTINLTNIKYFCDAVKLGGISAAAKANFVTQSAISQGIAKLEKSLGISLVAHHPNRFRLTPQGEVAFKHSLDILQKAIEFKENLFGDHQLMGTLEFASTYSFAVAVIPQYLMKFREAFPQVKVNFNLGKNVYIKQLLKAGMIDFGIVPDEGDLTGFDKRDIYCGNFKLYASRHLNTMEIKKLGFILAEPDCKETVFLKKAYYRKYGKELTGILEVSSWEVIANLVAEGMGIGYFPDYIAMKRRCFQEYDLGLDIQQYRLSAISPQGMKLRKSSETFLSYFNDRSNFLGI